MANKHLGVGFTQNYRCRHRHQVCSVDNKSCRHECYKKRNPEDYQQEMIEDEEPIFDNLDVINDAFGEKLQTADERLTAFQTHSGNKNKRAINGAVRATREQFECHFTDELDEHAKRRWWDNEEYQDSTPISHKEPQPDTNWMNRLDHYRTGYDQY